ncbi:RcnB family protein [Brevundimonas vesicularis]|uniref:RcnB family protein n=1 Tax=Brevundimonas vesicularis TaxID=41276 RepID=UPI0022AC37BB|nr:RcnB family protein [Brevundimonas vesicularis]
MKRLLMAFTAIAAVAGPLAAPMQALAQEQEQEQREPPRRERPYGGADRPQMSDDGSREPRFGRPNRPVDDTPRPERPSRPANDTPRPERPSGGERPNAGGQRPDRPEGGWNRPDRPNTGGQRLDRPEGGWNRPDRPNTGGQRRDRPEGGWNRPDRPDRPNAGVQRPDRPGNGWNRPDRPGSGWNSGRDRDRQHREFRQRFNGDQWRRDFYRNHRSDWWRNDRRFRGYNGVRVGFYFAPGWGYYSVPRSYWGRSWSVGQYLPDAFWRYQLNDWRTYGLGYPPDGTRWVSVDNTLYLIDEYDGYIIDVVRDAWRW